MKINLEDFVNGVYKKGYSMRAMWNGEISGEVTLFIDRLSFYDEDDLEIMLFSNDEFDKCSINFKNNGMVEIVADKKKWFFNISKNIDEKDFLELL